MSDGSSQKQDFSSVTAAAEAAAHLREIAGPVAPGAGAVKRAINIAAAATRLPHARVRALWYEAGHVWSEEMDLLRRKAREARHARNHETKNLGDSVADEIAELRRRLQRLEALAGGMARAAMAGGGVADAG